MQQQYLFIKDETGEVKQIVNVNLLFFACGSKDQEGSTDLCGAGFKATINLKFPEFRAALEKLIAENYKYDQGVAMAWHQKRNDDTEKTHGQGMRAGQMERRITWVAGQKEFKEIQYRLVSKPRRRWFWSITEFWIENEFCRMGPFSSAREAHETAAMGGIKLSA